MTIGRPYHKNPRTISRKRHKRPEGTLVKYGDLSGIVHNLETDEIIGGNQRVSIFENGTVRLVEQFDEPDEQGTVGLGFIIWKGKPYSYRQVRWDAATAKEANIEANLAGGIWDWDIFANQWDAGWLEGRGFDKDLLANWQADTFALGDLLGSENEKTPGADVEPQVDKAAELREKWGIELGQMWELGEHRLICGDCTDRAVVERVMEGERAEMMFTDPPYGVDYTGGHFHSGDVNIKRERPKLANDTDVDIYIKFLPVVLPFIGGPCYVWFASSVGKPVYDAIIDNNCEIHAMIIWNKINATYAAINAQYKQRHEPCMYFKPKGSTLRWVGPTDECTVWDEKRDSVNEYHPTQKPVVLPERAIKNHDAQIILDCFCGSGSTIIACENLNRKAKAIEIDPGYVAVSLQRWADLTGREPLKLTD